MKVTAQLECFLSWKQKSKWSDGDIGMDGDRNANRDDKSGVTSNAISVLLLYSV